MPESLFDTTITIKKRTKTAENSYGEPTYTTTDRYTNIKARYEEEPPVSTYEDKGQRDISDMLIYIGASYDEVEIQDTVFEGTTYLGIVRDVFKAYAPNGNGISHFELMIEKPSEYDRVV